MEELFFTKVWEAIKVFAESIDWFFLLLFIIITWQILEGIKYAMKKWKLSKAITTSFVFVLGVLLAIGYAYVYGIEGKSEIADLFYSILFGMILYKVGIDKIFSWMKNKLNEKK